jgi:hypothetical protein
MREQDFRKYLQKNPGSFIPELAAYRHCVVIPAWNENASLPEVLDSIGRARKDEPIAVIVVVNHPAEADPVISLEMLDILSKRAQWGVFSLYAPELKGGVGEARKLGMDCFTRSRDFKQLKDSVIFSLDGDSPVREEYFSESLAVLAQNPDSPGIIIKIRHSQAETREQEEAIREYERYMFRYAQKLKDAGSPYGFVCIGSGFAVRTKHYIQSGGMKIKKAGEDFYFLQELAKQGTLCHSRSILVHPSPRISERVPFGTGRSVKDLLSGNTLNDIPDSAFENLAILLKSAASPDGFLSPGNTGIIPGDEPLFLQSEKFPQIWQSILKNTPNDHNARYKAFCRWFDGLKTLRFLHACQRSEK